MALLLLLGSCALRAGAQGASPETKPPPPSDDPAPTPVAQSQPAPEILPEAKIPAGASVYLLIVEPVGNSDFSAVPYRTSTEDWYKKLTKEFEKQGRYRMVQYSNEAAVVFFVLRSWKASYPHSLNYFALALSQNEYKKHVERLNIYRGIAHVEDMLPGALWGTGRNYNMAKHWTVGLATAGLLNLGRPNPVDLVKQFHHDME